MFLQFESDLTLPDYRMEEDTFHVIDYAKKLEKNILIQTRLDKHPLLDVIFSGNYKDFLTYMSQERKMFHYPPYTDFACIWVHDRSQDRVRDIVSKLASKLLGIKDDDQFLAYDRDIWEKRRGEWVQKIILK